MKIGVFLGYGPQSVLKKEGIGRYLGGLLQGFINSGHEILLVCPQWQKNSLSELLKDFGLDETKMNVKSTKNIPPIWLLYKTIFLNKSSGKIRLILKQTIFYLTNCISAILGRMITTDSNVIFLITSMILCLGILVTIVCLFKCFTTLGFFSALLTISGIVSAIMIFYRKKEIRKYLQQYKKTGLSRLVALERSLLEHTHVRFAFEQMCDAEVRRLVSIANDLQEKPDCWFVPSLFWPRAAELKTAPVVFNAPDLIPEIFAVGFAGKATLTNFTDCRKTLRQGKWFITYGEYVRNSLLIEENRLLPELSFAIGHANNDMSSYLAIHKDITKLNNTDKDLSKEFAHTFLGNYQRSRYIFFASQLRPNKNILNLIKAFEFLLRKRFMHLKLFLTADLTKDERIETYINDHLLQNEVVLFCNVSAQHLAALYHSAELVVNPTLYEGSFPFTFGEGMSVGTPSIMSDIPQTREVLEPAGLEEIMFDPYDWRSIAEKIEWALERRQELYEKELPLYRELAKRTPDVVAAEYVKTFEYIIEQEKQAKLQETIV